MSLLNITLSVFIILTVLSKYMMLNKVWVRKHESEVADSVSVSALIIDVVVTIPFLFASFNHFDTNLMVKSSSDIIRDSVLIITTLMMFLIGIGYWINNGLSFKAKFKRALKMDRKEFKSLLKDVVMPGSITDIFRVLCMFAIIDNELHEQEVELLQQFAGEYDINYDEVMGEVQEEFAQKSESIGMGHLKLQVEKYLETSPPKNVVIWLQDLIDKIIRADNVVTEEEDIVSSEILAELQNYVEGDNVKKEMFHILLIPQDKDEEESILAIDSKLEQSRAQLFGSKKAYVVDSFFSERFAEIVRAKYLNLFKCFVTIEKY